MRRLAYFLSLLLVTPLLVWAADRAPRDDGPVAFQGIEIGGEGDEEPAEDGKQAEPEKPDLNKIEFPPPDDAPGTEYKNEDSNTSVTLPAGWTVGQEGGDPDGIFRFSLERHVRGTDAVPAVITMWRYRGTNAAMFTSQTPGEVLEEIEKGGLFEQWFGKDSAGRIQPDVNGGVYLGGLYEHSAGFTYRGIMPEETQKLREIEELIRRGDKNAKLPDYPDIVVHGRIGMLSPYVYLLISNTSRGFGDHPGLNAEITQIFDGFKFLQSEAIPPALNIAGESIGDTFADETLKKERKVSIPHTGKQPRKTYEIEIQFKLPPGWSYVDDASKFGTDQISAIVYAQDANHNWIKITLQHVCFRESSMQNSVEQDCESFKTNWQGRATRTDIPRDVEKVAIGGLRGKGYRELTGYIGEFPGRFQGLITDEGGWRHIITIDSIGDFDVFKKDLKSWERSLRIRD